MELQFLIDGTDYGHPQNWRDIRIKYERDREVRGLFTLYSSEVIFGGNAYQYIKSVYDLDTCSTIEIEINYRCFHLGSFSNLITGVLEVNSVTFDLSKCTAKLTVEGYSGASVFFKSIDRKVDIGAIGTAIDKTLFREILNVTDPNDNSSSVNSACTATASAIPFFGKKISLIFEQLVDELSIGNLGFKSDFFSTAYQSQKWEIKITAPPLIGETATLIFEDVFGNTYKYQYTSDGVLANFGLGLAEIMFYNTVTYPFLGSTEPANVTVTNASPYIIEFETFFSLRLDTSDFVSGAATVTQTQSFKSGGANTVWIPGECYPTSNYTAESDAGINYARFNAGIIKRSFKDFFVAMSSIYNLGMEIYDDAGTPKVRVEPIAYFYTSTPALTIRNIKELQKELNTDVLGPYLLLGRDDENTIISNDAPALNGFTTGLTTEYKYETGIACENSEIDRTVDGEYAPLYGVTLDSQMQGAVSNEKWLYSAEVDSSWNLKPFTFEVFNVGFPTGWEQSCTFGCFIAPVNQLYFHGNNIPSITYNEREFFRYNLGLGNFLNTTTTPTVWAAGEFFTDTVYKFDRYISMADWNSIVSSQQITVNQGDDVLDDQDAFIRMVEFRVFDGWTRFELEAKE